MVVSHVSVQMCHCYAATVVVAAPDLADYVLFLPVLVALGFALVVSVVRCRTVLCVVVGLLPLRSLFLSLHPWAQLL